MKFAIAFFLFAAIAVSQETNLAGTWKGDWTGGQASGGFEMTIRPEAEGNAKLEVSFTVNGEDVKTTVTSVTIEGPKITAQYEFDLQGNRLQSTITGELKGETLEGRYETRIVPAGTYVDNGSWKTTAAKQGA